MIESKDARGWTALHLACAQNHLEICKLLVLEQQANVNSLTHELSTPLIVAAYNGSIEIVKFLLENHANPNLVDHVGDTALIIARQRKKQTIVTLLESVEEKKGKDVLLLLAPDNDESNKRTKSELDTN